MSLLQFQCPGYADEIEDESKRLGMQSMGKNVTVIMQESSGQVR